LTLRTSVATVPGLALADVLVRNTHNSDDTLHLTLLYFIDPKVLAVLSGASNAAIDAACVNPRPALSGALSPRPRSPELLATAVAVLPAAATAVSLTVDFGR
jgi:hypothetical protein